MEVSTAKRAWGQNVVFSVEPANVTLINLDKNLNFILIISVVDLFVCCFLPIYLITYNDLLI